MALALGRLRITPRDFWSLTMPELGALLRGLFGHDGASGPAIGRPALEALLARFPD